MTDDRGNDAGRHGSAAPERWTLIYDGACGSCTAWAAGVRRWDRDRRIALLPSHDPQVARIAPGVTRARLDEAVHLVSPDGRAYAGAAALEQLARLLPLARPFAPLFALPFVRPLAAAAYRFIARRRVRACAIHGRTPRADR